MARLRQEQDRLHPFVLRGFDFFYRCVQVAGDDFHHLGQTFVLGLCIAADHDIGRVFFGEVSLFGHAAPRTLAACAGCRIAVSTRRNSAAGFATISSARQAT